MSSPTPTSARAELFRALGVLAEPPGAEHARLAALVGLPVPSRSDWTEAFMVQLPPHASIYLGPEGMLGGEAADRVAGFWRALRLRVPADSDHVTALLGLYATLLETEANETAPARRLLWREARTALLHEHLLSWLLVYAAAMDGVGPAPYRRWASLLRGALAAETIDIGAPSRLPMHLRDVPALSWTGEGLDTLLDELLAPVRAGFVVTRAHLAAAARRTSLGLRIGDRRRMLRGLLEQDPPATLGWLAEQANAWSARHAADEYLAGPVAAYWAERATATQAALAASTSDYQHAEPPR
jgi:TorA maturation chaperone TorD